MKCTVNWIYDKTKQYHIDPTFAQFIIRHEELLENVTLLSTFMPTLYMHDNQIIKDGLYTLTCWDEKSDLYYKSCYLNELKPKTRQKIITYKNK